jgi:hypothetical protein
MDIESRLGKGTRVTLRLPIDCENDKGDAKKGVTDAGHGNVEPLPLPVSSVDHVDVQVRKRA